MKAPSFSVGQKVFHTKSGHIWLVINVDMKNNRCNLKRATPDKTFYITSAFKYLIDQNEHIKLKTEAAKKAPKEVQLEKQKKADEAIKVPHNGVCFSGVNEAIKLMDVIAYCAHAALITSIEMKRIYLPSYSLRKVQRILNGLAYSGILTIDQNVKKHCITYLINESHKEWIQAYLKTITDENGQIRHLKGVKE